MKVQTNTDLSILIKVLSTPILIFHNSEDTKSLIQSLQIEGEIKGINTGHRITTYPNTEIVKVVRPSEASRISNVDKYPTVIYV